MDNVTGGQLQPSGLFPSPLKARTSLKYLEVPHKTVPDGVATTSKFLQCGSHPDRTFRNLGAIARVTPASRLIEGAVSPLATEEISSDRASLNPYQVGSDAAGAWTFPGEIPWISNVPRTCELMRPHVTWDWRPPRWRKCAAVGMGHRTARWAVGSFCTPSAISSIGSKAASAGAHPKNRSRERRPARAVTRHWRVGLNGLPGGCGHSPTLLRKVKGGPPAITSSSQFVTDSGAEVLATSGA